MLFPPEGVNEEAEILKNIRAGKRIEHFETRRVRKDGTAIDVSLTISPIVDSGGSLIGVSKIARETGERRRLEERLRRSQKMEAMGRLAGGVAHDFNNTLTAILGFSQIALEGLAADHPLHETVLEIRKAGERATELTRRLLAFSRQQLTTPRVLDLNKVVEGISEMLRRVIGEHIEIATRLSPELGNVISDQAGVEQAITNLVVNARDAMPQGGKITIETSNVDLDEEYCSQHAGVAPGPHVMLAVTDTGKGMSKETLSHLFEPFFTIKPQGKGTGLGLTTVYGAVKQSRGHVAVYSEPDHGSTFKLFFPRTDESRDPTPVPAPASPEIRGKETVLAVEDDDAIRLLLQKQLKAKGFSAHVFGSPDDAIAFCRSFDGGIDLLLTDVIMPRMNGRALADAIKGLRPGLKVLFISGYAPSAIVDLGLALPDSQLLMRPFSHEALVRKIREVLDGRSPY